MSMTANVLRSDGMALNGTCPGAVILNEVKNLA